MIVDITGTILIPGNMGNDCPGNGEHYDQNGKQIVCCCDECDYLQCCTQWLRPEQCASCREKDCPHSGKYPLELAAVYDWKRIKKDPIVVDGI